MIPYPAFQWLLRQFALQSRQDAVVKPLSVMVATVAAFCGIAVLVVGADWDILPAAALTTIVVQMPFTALLFAMTAHVERLRQSLSLLQATDTLTGVLNRRVFVDRAGLRQAQGSRGIILLIDVDDFKGMNERYGHGAGDRCLKSIAKRLRDVFASADLIGRLGNGEFGVYITPLQQTSLLDLTDDLQRPIMVRTICQETPVPVTLSIGIARTQQQELIAAALSRADQALCSAKARGGAKMSIWPQGTAHGAYRQMRRYSSR